MDSSTLSICSSCT